MTDHQLAILGILIGAMALRKTYEAEARAKYPRAAFPLSILATLLIIAASAFVAAHA